MCYTFGAYRAQNLVACAAAASLQSDYILEVLAEAQCAHQVISARCANADVHFKLHRCALSALNALNALDARGICTLHDRCRTKKIRIERKVALAGQPGVTLAAMTDQGVRLAKMVLACSRKMAWPALTDPA